MVRPPARKPSAGTTKHAVRTAKRKTAPRTTPVVAAVKRDLAALDKGLAQSGLALAALELAKQLDARDNSATSKSMCARALREALDRLRELNSELTAGQAQDALDDLSARRAARIADRESKPARRKRS